MYRAQGGAVCGADPGCVGFHREPFQGKPCPAGCPRVRAPAGICPSADRAIGPPRCPHACGRKDCAGNFMEASLAALHTPVGAVIINSCERLHEAHGTSHTLACVHIHIFAQTHVSLPSLVGQPNASSYEYRLRGTSSVTRAAGLGSFVVDHRGPPGVRHAFPTTSGSLICPCGGPKR